MAGGAYLPVGPQLPALRRERILADAGAVAVITDAEAEARLEWPPDLPRIVTAPPSGTPAGSAQAGPADPADLAYVIYTSGSTGTPKGVMIEHRAALNTVADINERFGIGPADRLFGLADLGFDLSVHDLFGTFAAGAALVLPDPDQRAEPAHWAEVMAAHGVTVWNSVPAQMQMLVEHLEAGGAAGAGGSEIPQDLRLVMLSGDWIPVDLPGRIHALWPDARVISLGGATEVSIWSIFHPVEEVPAGATSVPYGKPLRNQSFHVLDERYAPCPVWTAGELYIGGHGLARGYRGDPERTAAAFVTHPRTGERLYRTGDFGRYLPDGSIEFLGRRDGQVKINGHRVELGEIEATLTRHPGVDSAVVVKADGEAGAARLLGYVVPARGTTVDVDADAAGGTAGDAAGADGLFVTEHADPERADADWQALRAAAEVPAPGPSPQALRTAWDVLNEVYATAVGTAFRRLGLPDNPAAAVAPRYERWLARATAARPPAADGIPRELADRSRTVLREVLGIPEDVTDWMLALAGDIDGVLTQSVHSAELYASDRTPGVYERLFGPTYAVAAEAVRRLVAGWPADRPLRVLEVGAGYGSLTRHLLPLLPADRAARTAPTEYVFTDISRYFTDRAREVFGAEHPFLRCDLLDLDAPPETQGFEDHSADLVIAASVLHDMRRVRRTLRNLRGLLAPGGTLLIVEQTSFHPWFDLVMGLQQGFDNFEDTDLRTTHPLLGREQWAAELAAAGFTDCAVLTPSGGGPGSVGFDVLVARGPARRRRFAPDALRDFAAGQLAAHMVPSQLFALTELPLSGTGKVDRKALAKAGARTVARGRPAKPPRTDRQRKLVEIWRDVLGLSSADLADDFLEAGGDSLLAARLVATLRTAFGITVPVGTVLQYTTVEALDGHLEGLLGPSEPLTEETR
jgi:pyochelin synthetase